MRDGACPQDEREQFLAECADPDMTALDVLAEAVSLMSLQQLRGCQVTSPEQMTATAAKYGLDILGPPGIPT